MRAQLTGRGSRDSEALRKWIDYRERNVTPVRQSLLGSHRRRRWFYAIIKVLHLQRGVRCRRRSMASSGGAVLGVCLGGPEVYDDMQQWSQIRRQVLVEGVRKREVLRQMDMHWRTVEKILTDF